MNLFLDFSQLRDRLRALLSQRAEQNVFVFGTGDGARLAGSALDSLGASPTAYVDNNAAKRGSVFLGRPVWGVDQLLGEAGGKLVLVASATYYAEIAKQLAGMGFAEGRDFLPAFPLTQETQAAPQTSVPASAFQRDPSLKQYQDLHAGKRCIIMGNGPSLNDTDLTLLNDEIVIGLNKVHLLFDRIPWRPAYVVSFIEEVIKQAQGGFETLEMPLFLSQWGRPYMANRKGPTHYFGPNKRFAFSLNPVEEVTAGFTVTYVAMQLAFYMGFKKVILIGVDHNFNYDGPSSTWQTLEQTHTGRHFIDNYFQPGEKWESPNLPMAEAHYALARAVFQHFGREIVDATAGGKLTVYRKTTLAEALAEEI